MMAEKAASAASSCPPSARRTPAASRRTSSACRSSVRCAAPRRAPCARQGGRKNLVLKPNMYQAAAVAAPVAAAAARRPPLAALPLSHTPLRPSVPLPPPHTHTQPLPRPTLPGSNRNSSTASSVAKGVGSSVAAMMIVVPVAGAAQRATQAMLLTSIQTKHTRSCLQLPVPGPRRAHRGPSSLYNCKQQNGTASGLAKMMAFACGVSCGLCIHVLDVECSHMQKRC
jgi:hypothetical protein